MNHWFLVARDIMWFGLGCSPIFYAITEEPWIDPTFRIMTAMIMQWVGITLLYFQVIK